MRYLLDTCVLAEYTKPSQNAAVLEWLDACTPEDVFLSVLTIGEIEKGVSRLSSSKRRTSLESFLESLIFKFDSNILPISLETVRVWGKMNSELEKLGRPLPAIDSLLAATALEHKLVIVTRNEKDFQPANIGTLNIWK